MSPIDPPFRADHVGSLLRPKAVLDAREQFADGAITAADKRAVEDEAIADAVQQVESVGMRSITDGEFRRTWFHLDFLEQLAGVEVSGAIAASSNAAETVHFTPPRLAVTGPLRHVRDIQVDDFTYLAGVTTQTPKVSIPSPDDGALPRRARRRSTSSRIPISTCSSPISPSATATRSPRCTRPAAATSSSTTPTSRTCAIRRCAPAPSSVATTPTSCRARTRR